MRSRERDEKKKLEGIAEGFEKIKSRSELTKLSIRSAPEMDDIKMLEEILIEVKTDSVEVKQIKNDQETMQKLCGSSTQENRGCY